MWLRIKLAWIAFRYPQFTKWALDNAARECLIGRVTPSFKAHQPEKVAARDAIRFGSERIATRIAAALDTKGEQSLDT